MNKKGLFFTVIVIAMFLVLFFLSNSYLSRTKDFEGNLKGTIISDQIRFIEDSIIFEYYNKIIDLKPGTIERLGEGQIRIDFPNAGRLPSLENKTEMIKLYKNYTEGRFSELSNVNITLINFYPNFTIVPYGSVFTKEGNNLTFYNFNYSYIRKVTIELKVNESEDDVDVISVPPSTNNDSNPTIKLKIRDTSGKGKGKGEEIVDEEVELNPIGRSSFFINFSSGSSVRVDFGNFNGNNGTFITSVNKLFANITLFEVRYATVNETVKVLGGNFTISKLGVTKNTELVIASE